MDLPFGREQAVARVVRVAARVPDRADDLPDELGRRQAHGQAQRAGQRRPGLAEHDHARRPARLALTERTKHLHGLGIRGALADDDDVWATLLRMLDDPSLRVRAEAVHAVTDSTPRARIGDVIDALEQHRNERDLKLRRRIRKTLAHYYRTGRITDSPS